jgi:hypothetical protein
MSCTRESLLTNVTRDPAGTVSVRGDTPADVIVNVVPPGVGVGVGVGVGDGVGDGVGEGDESLPPHAAVATAAARTTARSQESGEVIRRTSWRC